LGERLIQGVYHVPDGAADLAESFVPSELSSVSVERDHRWAPPATDLLNAMF
jgi:hypothetical protein